MPVVQSGKPASLARRLGLLLVVLGIAVFVIRGVHDEAHVLQSRDFKQPYASARCLLHGCDPYNEADTHTAFLRAGGEDVDAQVFVPYSALYPPFSLAVLTPVATLDYPAAHRVWLTLTAILFSIAILLIADLCRGPGSPLTLALLGILTATSTILLMLGQISGPVIALLAIGFWCLLRQRGLWLAVLAFSLALSLKPHDAVLLVCYLPFAGSFGRRTFAGVAALTTVIVVAGCLWCSHHPASAQWLPELRANLAGNAAPGAADDPSRSSSQAMFMANLQPLFAVLTPKHAAYVALSLGTTLLVLLAWLPPALRLADSFQKHTVAVACLACLTLLPLYHRQYDTRLLLLVFPAIPVLLAWRRAWGATVLLLLALATVLTSHQYLQKVAARWFAGGQPASLLKAFLLLRPMPLAELLLAIALVAAFRARLRAEHAPS